MDRMQRIESALAAVRERFGRKDELIERLQTEKTEAATLMERMRQRAEEAESRADAFRAELHITIWAELESGAAIAQGDKVRYALRVYECIKPHTKALTRRPTDAEYWKAA